MFAGKRIIRVLVFILISFSVQFVLNGCIFNIEKSTADSYSREWVSQRVSSIGFGRSGLDDIPTILNYLYNDPDLIERFGKGFEVSSDDDYAVSGGMGSENGPFSKDIARYEIKIEDTAFYVVAEKSYFGKWHVVECTEVTSETDS